MIACAAGTGGATGAAGAGTGWLTGATGCATATGLTGAFAGAVTGDATGGLVVDTGNSWGVLAGRGTLPAGH